MLLLPRKIKVKKIIKTNNTEFSNCEGQIGERIKNSWHRERRQCRSLGTIIYSPFSWDLAENSTQVYVFISSKETEIEISVMCDRMHTKQRISLKSCQMCKLSAGHSSRPDPWSIQQESYQADLCPTGYCWTLSKCGSRWEKVQSRLDSIAEFSDRPCRSGNRLEVIWKKAAWWDSPASSLIQVGNSP